MPICGLSLFVEQLHWKKMVFGHALLFPCLILVHARFFFTVT